MIVHWGQTDLCQEKTWELLFSDMKACNLSKVIVKPGIESSRSSYTALSLLVLSLVKAHSSVEVQKFLKRIVPDSGVRGTWRCEAIVSKGFKEMCCHQVSWGSHAGCRIRRQWAVANRAWQVPVARPQQEKTSYKAGCTGIQNKCVSSVHMVGVGCSLKEIPWAVYEAGMAISGFQKGTRVKTRAIATNRVWVFVPPASACFLKFQWRVINYPGKKIQQNICCNPRVTCHGEYINLQFQTPVLETLKWVLFFFRKPEPGCLGFDLRLL